MQWFQLLTSLSVRLKASVLLVRFIAITVIGVHNKRLEISV
jgi:hypothetical protein